MSRFSSETTHILHNMKYLGKKEILYKIAERYYFIVLSVNDTFYRMPFNLTYYKCNNKKPIAYSSVDSMERTLDFKE